jgi:hypothetical protein
MNYECQRRSPCAVAWIFFEPFNPGPYQALLPALVVFQQMSFSNITSGTMISYMIFIMISYNLDILPDIIVLNHYDIIVLWYHSIVLWYHSTMISCLFLYDIMCDIKIIWYHTSESMIVMISFMISYIWIYDIKIIWYHRSMIS